MMQPEAKYCGMDVLVKASDWFGGVPFSFTANEAGQSAASHKITAVAGVAAKVPVVRSFALTNTVLFATVHPDTWGGVQVKVNPPLPSQVGCGFIGTGVPL